MLTNMICYFNMWLELSQSKFSMKEWTSETIYSV